MVIDVDIKPLFPGAADMERPIVMAGPCSAESEEQVMAIAKAVITMRVAHVAGFIPKPSQFNETKVTDTLAIEAMVIQPR